MGGSGGAIADVAAVEGPEDEQHAACGALEEGGGAVATEPGARCPGVIGIALPGVHGIPAVDDAPAAAEEVPGIPPQPVEVNDVGGRTGGGVLLPA
jgi:hypothetical protein